MKQVFITFLLFFLLVSPMCSIICYLESSVKQIMRKKTMLFGGIFTLFIFISFIGQADAFTLAPSTDQGINATSQSFKISNDGGGTLSYSISDNATWLSCTPTTGESTGEVDIITVNYSTSTLPAGTYQAAITVTATGVANSPQTIPVTLTVNAVPALPGISLSPASLSVSAVQGINATSQSFQVTNSGGGILSYTISDNATWISCTPASGTSTGEQDTVTVNYTTSGLSAGTYSAVITVTASGVANSPQTIPVTLTIKALPGISLNPASLSVTTAQGANASSQSFQVTNSGGGTLSYTISDNATWISCTPASGTSTGEQDTITVNFDTSGLSAGTYSATITITASGAVNSPQAIPVSLNVVDLGSARMIPWGNSNLAVSLSAYGSDNGIWSYNVTAWKRLTYWVPSKMISWGSGNVAAVFTEYGAGNGIWSYNGTIWKRLTYWVPSKMISWGSGNVAAVLTNYGTDNGVWSYNGTSWTKLTAWVPSEMISWGTGSLAAVFTNYGAGNGIWSNNGTTWKRLTYWVPAILTSWGTCNIAAVFTNYGTGNGIWSNNGTTWTKLTNWLPSSSTKPTAWGGSNLAATFTDYSTGNGIWSYNGSSWSKLTDRSAANLDRLGSSGSGDLVGIFDDYASDNGVWRYSGGAWLRITDWLPADVNSWSSNSVALLSTGSGVEEGIWSYNGTSMSKLTSWICDYQ